MPSFWMYSNARCSTPLRAVDSSPTIQTLLEMARLEALSVKAWGGKDGID